MNSDYEIRYGEDWPGETCTYCAAPASGGIISYMPRCEVQIWYCEQHSRTAGRDFAIDVLGVDPNDI